MGHPFGFSADVNALLPPAPLLCLSLVLGKPYNHVFNVCFSTNSATKVVLGLSFGTILSPDYLRREVSG